MNVAELIDIEHKFIEDSRVDQIELRKRDRKIGIELESKNLERRELFLTWLNYVRNDSYYSLGDRVVSVFNWMKFFAIISGPILGGTTALATLSYDGTHPVNVVNSLAVFVGLQVLLLLFLLFTFLPKPLLRLIPGKGDLLKVIGMMIFILSWGAEHLFMKMPLEKLQRFQADFKQLRMRHRLYSAVERWMLLGLTQRFGLAFNAGALSVCLYLITFSDLAFAWNTTLQVESATFHKMLKAIASPWAYIYPAGLPSLDLVEMTRYFRIEGQYQVPGVMGRTVDPVAVGGWWTFLVFSIIFYGLIPRLVVLVFTQLKLSWTLHKLPLDTADYDALYDRLTVPLVETNAPEPEQEISIEHIVKITGETIYSKKGPCLAVLWGDIALDSTVAVDLIKSRFNWDCKETLTAGGFDFKIDEATCSQLTSDKQYKTPILILVESWDVPNRAILHFMEAVRKDTLPERPLIIGLVNTERSGKAIQPNHDDWQSWQDILLKVEDPYLRIESMAL